MRDQYKPVFGNPVGDWFRWFAWRPVYTEDRGLRWLRFVWRRRCQKKFSLPGPAYTWFQQVVEKPETEREFLSRLHGGSECIINDDGLHDFSPWTWGSGTRFFECAACRISWIPGKSQWKEIDG